MKTGVTFLNSILSALIIFGMTTGLYNPRQTPFVLPPEKAIAAYEGETLDIIVDGESEYVIVVAADAIPAERTAAAKLRGFLAQISGAELRIIDDSSAPQAKEIVVGDTNRYALDHEALGLGTDGFVVRTAGEKLVLAGGKPRGTLYSVYGFCEKYLDCRWLSKDVKILPARKTVAVPAAIDELEIPAFLYRQPTTVYAQTSIDEDYALANRVNGVGMIPNSTWDEALGGVMFWPASHAGMDILPPHDRYHDGVLVVKGLWEEHPEYFVKNEDGSPMICPNGEENPCLTNPDVIQIYIDYAMRQMENNPDLQGISMGLNDSGTVCRCEGCRAVYAQEHPEAGQTGALMRVMNAVCEALEAAGYTQVTLNAFAYGTATYPPRVDLHRNIVIHFCPSDMCYAHRPGECDYEGNRYYFEEVLPGWGKIAKRVCIFEYPLSYNQPGIPFPSWGVLQDYIRFYYENSVVGMTQCAATVNDVGLYVMLGYLYARLLWDPYLDMEALYGHFLPGYYGEGWRYIREYIRIASEEGTGRTIGGVTYHSNCMDGASTKGILALTTNQIKYIEGLWEKAGELAGSDWQLDNVRRAELSFRTWKGDNFRREFSIFNPFKSRIKANKDLYDDYYELLFTEQVFYDVYGNRREYRGIYHNGIDWWVTPSQFYRMKLYRLYPKLWSWRQIGGSQAVYYEQEVHTFWQLLFKAIL